MQVHCYIWYEMQLGTLADIFKECDIFYSNAQIHPLHIKATTLC